MARHHELVARSGDGDVRQPTLLEQLVGTATRGVLPQPLRARLAHLRQVDVVASERGWQLCHGGRPARPPLGRREHLAGQASQEDDVPLQAFGAVNRQQLDGVGLGRHGEGKSLAVLVLRRKVCQQAGQRRVAVDAGEGSHGVEKCREVVASSSRHRRGRRSEFDVQTGHLDDAADEVQQRLSDEPAQGPQLPRQQPEPLPRSSGVLGRAWVLKSFHERHDVGRVDTGYRLLQLARDIVGCTRGSAGQPACSSSEQGQVTGTDRPPRPGEQGQQ